MRLASITLALLLAATSAAQAQTPGLVPALSGLAFLVGSWGAGSGHVAETGGNSRGTSTITAEIGGAALLRRDHTELLGAGAAVTGSFDQIMLIYPEAGAIHADYSDGTHVIHYTSATIVAGRSVVFTTASSSTAPAFRLSYELIDPRTLSVRFEIAPPGAPGFSPVASGTLHRIG